MSKSELPDSAAIHRRYPGDVRIYGWVDDFEDRYGFEAPGHVGKEFPDPDLAELYADVYFAVGGFREERTGDRGIPHTVARDGQDTIAAYLLSACSGTSVTWLSRQFDVEKDTVRTYLSRVRRRARERREELDE